MASNTVKVHLLADASGFNKGMKEAETSAGRFGTTAAGIKNVVGGFFALQAVSGVVSFLADATTNAIADQKAQDQLALALENTTGATKDQIAATEDYIEKTARATGVSDDQLRPALGNLVRALGDVDLATDAMGTAMDIATARSLPLEAVTLAMGKAAQGNIGALGRLGLKVRDSSGDYLSFEEAMAEANRTMGGATETAAAGAEGSLGRLQIALDEAKEEIGTVFIPVLIDAADAVLGMFEAFERPVDLESMDSFTRSVADSDDGVIDISRSLGGLVDSFGALGDLLGITVEPVLGETYDVLSSLTPPIREVEEATIAVTDATEDYIDAFKENLDQARAAIDPFYAYADATRDVEEATLKARDAATEFGDGSVEHIEALGKVEEAARDVQDAEIAMADQGGLTADTLRTHLQRLGVYTKEEIDIIVAEFDRVNAFRFDAKTIRVTHEVTGGGVREYQTGGVVPGTGPQLAVVHGGETITPAHHRNGSRSASPGMTANITINAGMGSDPNAISRALVEALQRYERSNGPLPVHTK